LLAGYAPRGQDAAQRDRWQECVSVHGVFPELPVASAFSC